jgi:hypothetical protein
MSILNALRSGKFSSDRTIQEYAENIWKIKSCEVPKPSGSVEQRHISYIDTNKMKWNWKCLWKYEKYWKWVNILLVFKGLLAYKWISD